MQNCANDEIFEKEFHNSSSENFFSYFSVSNSFWANYLDKLQKNCWFYMILCFIYIKSYGNLI